MRSVKNTATKTVPKSLPVGISLTWSNWKRTS